MTSIENPARKRRMTAFCRYIIHGRGDVRMDQEFQPEYFDTHDAMYTHLLDMAAENDVVDIPVVLVASDKTSMTPLSAVLVLGKDIINERKTCSLDDIFYLQEIGTSYVKKPKKRWGFREQR